MALDALQGTSIYCEAAGGGGGDEGWRVERRTRSGQENEVLAFRLSPLCSL